MAWYDTMAWLHLVNSSLPGKCSPWSQDRLQFIAFALLFSPSYIVVTHNLEYNLYYLRVYIVIRT